MDDPVPQTGGIPVQEYALPYSRQAADRSGRTDRVEVPFVYVSKQLSK